MKQAILIIFLFISGVSYSQTFNSSIPSGVGTKAVRYDPTTKQLSYADTTTGGSSGITVGTTTITSGTNTRVLYNNSGVVGEYSITGTGNVALSASPTLTGTVNAAAITATGVVSSQGGVIQGDGLSVLKMRGLSGGANSLGIQFQNAAGDLDLSDIWVVQNVGDLNLRSYSTTNPGISIKNSTNLVQMPSYGAGTATFDASGNITSVSDERLKTAINPYKSGLKELLLLKPIQYKWNEKSGNETKETYAGFSAQNVKAVIPYGTGENKEGYLSLQERAIVATLVNAVKEQQQQIEELKREIIKLQQK